MFGWQHLLVKCDMTALERRLLPGKRGAIPRGLCVAFGKLFVFAGRRGGVWDVCVEFLLCEPSRAGVWIDSIGGSTPVTEGSVKGPTILQVRT